MPLCWYSLQMVSILSKKLSFYLHFRILANYQHQLVEPYSLTVRVITWNHSPWKTYIISRDMTQSIIPYFNCEECRPWTSGLSKVWYGPVPSFCFIFLGNLVGPNVGRVHPFYLLSDLCRNNRLTMKKLHVFHLIHQEKWVYSKLWVLDTFRYENTTKVSRHRLQKSLYSRVKLLMVRYTYIIKFRNDQIRPERAENKVEQPISRSDHFEDISISCFSRILILCTRSLVLPSNQNRFVSQNPKISQMWHDQRKWVRVTCRKFLFSCTTFSELQNASFWYKSHYNWISGYRVMMDLTMLKTIWNKGIWTLFRPIS